MVSAYVFNWYLYYMLENYPSVYTKSRRPWFATEYRKDVPARWNQWHNFYKIRTMTDGNSFFLSAVIWLRYYSTEKCTALVRDARCFMPWFHSLVSQWSIEYRVQYCMGENDTFPGDEKWVLNREVKAHKQDMFLMEPIGFQSLSLRSYVFNADHRWVCPA